MKIISGGQTGVDRGALDAAVALGIEHGGWCPLGRLAEDGCIPGRYRLRETETADYRERTERNVLDSDATLILCRGALSGGTELTRRLAEAHGRPCRVVDLAGTPPVEPLRRWLAEHRVSVLNVAGPRESQFPGITTAAQEFIEQLFAEESNADRPTT